jgi:hypothetical protein
MNKSLFDIQKEYLELVDELLETEGELTPELEKKLEINKNDLEQKVLAYDKIIKLCSGDIETAKVELERIGGFIQSKQRIIDKLKQTLLNTLLIYGNKDNKEIYRLEFNTIKLSTRKSKSVYFEDESEISSKYIKFTIKNLDSDTYLSIIDTLGINNAEVDSKISKTLIKEDLEKNEIVAGAVLKENLNLVIK